jgi:hypothetical protein
VLKKQDSHREKRKNKLMAPAGNCVGQTTLPAVRGFQTSKKHATTISFRDMSNLHPEEHHGRLNER